MEVLVCDAGRVSTVEEDSPDSRYCRSVTILIPRLGNCIPLPRFKRALDEVGYGEVIKL